MRLLRLLSNSKRFIVIASTFVKLIPAFTNLFGLLFVICFVYALIGVQAFGGIIYLGNPVLNGTIYLDPGTINDTQSLQYYYVTMNFNNFGSAMVTLFEMLIVSNISTLTFGLMAAVGWWSAVYYLSFWILAVCVILNLLVAFILEGFIDNYERQKRGERLEDKTQVITEQGNVVFIEQHKPTTVYDLLNSTSSTTDDS